MKLLLKKEKDSQKNIHREVVNVQLFITRRIYVSLPEYFLTLNT